MRDGGNGGGSGSFRVSVQMLDSAGEYTGGGFECPAGGGENLLKALRRADVPILSPCNGNGTCGKCRVRASGGLGGPSEGEMKLLGREALDAGWRLACCCKVSGDAGICVPERGGAAQIAVHGIRRETALDPFAAKVRVTMQKPSLEDQADDAQRVLRGAEAALAGISGAGAASGGLPGKGACGGLESAASAGRGHRLRLEDMGLIRQIPRLVREGGYDIHVIAAGDRITGAEPAGASPRCLGAAVDIGTTTVAAYLCDISCEGGGALVDTFSMLNPQRAFGADVISRISFTMSEQDGIESMRSCIIGCLNKIIDNFAERNAKNGVSRDSIYEMTIVGNTTMIHLALGLPAEGIASAPFVPASTGLHILPAEESGIGINRAGAVVFLPGVSGYIGSDTVAAVLACGMHQSKDVAIMVDIGTNGEIVLSCGGRMYACSTAAGPAFEGANIRNGVGGVAGAIDAVRMAGDLEFTTIGGGRPVGLCGSGVVDAVAELLRVGIIDETGRIQGADELEDPAKPYAGRLIDIDGKKAFLIAKAGDGAAGMDIAITQKDIRELQNAKAAIAAGVKTLIKRAGLSYGDIDALYLAGGFGNYINRSSAVKIGLLPQELEGKIVQAGNAAGSGGVEALLSAGVLNEALDVKSRIEYIELSASPDFTDEYVECMMFE